MSIQFAEAFQSETVSALAVWIPEEPRPKTNTSTPVPPNCVSDNPVGAAVFVYQDSRPIPEPYPVAAVFRNTFEPGRLAAQNLADKLNEISLDTAVLRLASPVRGRTPLRLVHNIRDLHPHCELQESGSRGGQPESSRRPP